MRFFILNTILASWTTVSPLYPSILGKRATFAFCLTNSKTVLCLNDSVFRSVDFPKQNNTIALIFNQITNHLFGSHFFLYYCIAKFYFR